MHQQELLRILQDESLFLTENYIDHLCQVFDKPIDKLQMLDEVAEIIAPEIHPYALQNSEQSGWKTWVPMWKPKAEIRDLKDKREKVEQLKTYYQNICKQDKNNPEIKAQIEKSPLLKIKTIHSPNTDKEEGYEMKEMRKSK